MAWTYDQPGITYDQAGLQYDGGSPTPPTPVVIVGGSSGGGILLDWLNKKGIGRKKKRGVEVVLSPAGVTLPRPEEVHCPAGRVPLLPLAYRPEVVSRAEANVTAGLVKWWPNWIMERNIRRAVQEETLAMMALFED